MERFEAISKLLLTKIVDEREATGSWPGGVTKSKPELIPSSGDDDRILYERARAVWQRTVSAHPRIFGGSKGKFPADVAGVARIVRLLAEVSLSATPTDIKGGAYEEILRNTFEKNENQQFFTPRNVVEFMVSLANPRESDAVCDPAAGSGGFLVAALEFVSSSKEDVAGFAAKIRAAEVDDRMAWVARINLLLHGGDPTTVRHLGGAGSLAPFSKLGEDLPEASFDVILTNPPFGSDMTDAQALASLETGQGRRSRRRGVLFLERCLDLLKPGGRLVVVLDDSVLNLPGNADVRHLVRERSVVEAVISLPDVTFMPYSTAKSSILVLRRRKDRERQDLVFMADVEHVGTRPNGDPLYSDALEDGGTRKLLSDLPVVLKYWDHFPEKAPPAPASDGLVVFQADIASHQSDADGDRLDVFFFHPLRADAESRLKKSVYPLVPLGDLMRIDGTAVVPAEEFGDSALRWIGLGDIEALTGRYEVKTVLGDRLKSNAHPFRAGDILHSRLRPRLRKTILIPDGDEGGLCSGELLVLRPHEQTSTAVSRDYIAYLLRSDLIFGQVLYRVTGIGRPRVSAAAISRTLVPLPDLDRQESIVRGLRRSESAAGDLRTQARMLRERAAEVQAAAFAAALDELLT